MIAVLLVMLRGMVIKFFTFAYLDCSLVFSLSGFGYFQGVYIISCLFYLFHIFINSFFI